MKEDASQWKKVAYIPMLWSIRSASTIFPFIGILFNMICHMTNQTFRRCFHPDT